MARHLRVLFVEDSEDDTQLLLRHLARAGFDVTHARVDTRAAMQDALGQNRWDVVLSDHTMPGFSAAEALSTLRQAGFDLPFIIVSGTIGEETAVDALKAGAHDFLTKDKLGRLVPAIEREMRDAAERRKRRAAEAALAETRERMRFALDAAGVGVWESDLTSGRTVWSDVLERMHGLEPGGFGGTLDSLFELVHPGDRERVEALVRQSFRDRTPLRTEYRTVWPDGSTHWIATIGRTFFDAGGAPVRAAGIDLDVTA